MGSLSAISFWGLEIRLFTKRTFRYPNLFDLKEKCPTLNARIILNEFWAYLPIDDHDVSILTKKSFCDDWFCFG